MPAGPDARGARTARPAFAFETLRLHRIEAACIPDNPARCACLKKPDFSAKDCCGPISGSTAVWQDHYLYALIADDRRAAGTRTELLGTSVSGNWHALHVRANCPGALRRSCSGLSRRLPAAASLGRSSRSRSRATTSRSTSPAPSRSIATRARTSRFRPRPVPTASCGASRSRPTTPRSTGDWAVFALANTDRPAARPADRRAAFPAGRFRAVLARSRLEPHRRDHAERRLRARPAGRAPTPTSSG